MNTDELRPWKIRVERRIKLEKCQSWEESFHVFDEESAFAVEMALATGRPLLVRGEPGIGKSQLARAAAQELNRYFVAEVITAASEGRDLLWQYDPVARLNDAQTLAAQGVTGRSLAQPAPSEKSTVPTGIAVAKASQQTLFHRKKKTARHRKKKSASLQKKFPYQVSRAGTATIERINVQDKKEGILHPANYISPGVLWWIFDDESARRQYQQCAYPFYKPGFIATSDEASTKCGFVLLIDEIDKADSALPNSLLEVLGNGGFHVPLLDESVGMRTHKKPLVIITTNEERPLPSAFIRRCLVLNLRFDDEEYLRFWWKKQTEKFPRIYSGAQFNQELALIRWLSERAEIHFKRVFTDRVKEKAAELLIKDRKAARQAGLPKPGQAEYLDLLQALREMPPAPDKRGESGERYQLALLEKISRYALVKSPPE